jgi:polyisoprenoid-binding protein YceI
MIRLAAMLLAFTPALAASADETTAEPLALAVDWSVAADSALGFRASAQGETFEGRFSRFDARIRFAPDALTNSRFEVEIDLRSVDSQNSERDEMLADSAFFDSNSQPQAQYLADRFTALEDGRFRAEGTLTLRGVSAPVTLDFQWSATDTGAALVGEATLDRMTFKVGDGEWQDPDAIAHEVRVMTTLQLIAAPSAAP